MLPPNVFSWLCKALQSRRADCEDYPTKGCALNFALEDGVSAQEPHPSTKAKRAPAALGDESEHQEHNSWSELRRPTTTCSPGSTVSTEACADCDMVHFDLDEDVPEVLSATLDPALGLCLRESVEVEASSLLRASRLELREGAGLRAVGVRSARSDEQCQETSQEPEITLEQEVDLGADCLIVDVRIDPLDDPRPVQLVGSQLRGGGRVKGLALQQGPEGAEAMCEVHSRRGQQGGQDFVLMRLGDVIEELRGRELQRRNAELLAYQRRVCSSLMGQQRRRFLGLDGVAAAA